jgi:phage I-like protein
VNYRYPCPDAEQTAVAARYWAKEENRRQYTRDEQEIISRRLEEKKKKFKVGEYAQENKDLRPVVLSARVTPGEVPEYIQVLPFGEVRSEKGDFVVDEESVREILRDWEARQSEMVIDYEHQTLGGEFSSPTGHAPAAGWVKALEDRGAKGLWARVEWTPRAAEYLRNKEYRYLSPVVLVRKSDRRAVRLHSFALTNTPAIDGMVPLVNKRDFLKEGTGLEELLKQLRLKLSLPATATAEEIITAVDGLNARVASAGQVVAAKEVLELLEVPENADINTVKGKILALKNPSGYVRVEEFNALKEKLQLRERDELVALAMSQGKIAPAQKEWAEQYALKDPEGFRAFLKQAPQVVPVGQDIAGGGGLNKGGALSEAETLVCKQLGISEETYRKYGGER